MLYLLDCRNLPRSIWTQERERIFFFLQNLFNVAHVSNPLRRLKAVFHFFSQFLFSSAATLYQGSFRTSFVSIHSTCYGIFIPFNVNASFLIFLTCYCCATYRHNYPRFYSNLKS